MSTTCAGYPPRGAVANPAPDNTRTNNVNQHFVTAFLDQTFKGKDHSSTGNYLNPVHYADYPNSAWPTSTIWRGFPV
jgi:hypothetical protein